MYDIEPEDAYGHAVSPNQQVQIILPIDAGKTVAKVFFLPENAQPQALNFREVTKIVEGQVVTFVIFDVEHFSQYGIIYKTQAAENKTLVEFRYVSQIAATVQNHAAVRGEDTSEPFENLQKVAVVENSTLALPKIGQKDSKVLTFTGILSLASLAVLEVKRRKKNQ